MINDLERKYHNCLACGDKLTGRIDKKFCHDRCRNTYNNRVVKGEESKSVYPIYSILRSNWKTLRALLNERDHVRVLKKRLDRKNFDYKYMTHTYKNNQGQVYTFCFDVGYIRLPNDEVLIVKGIEE